MGLHYVFFLGNHPELSLVEAWRALVRGGFSPRLIHTTPAYAHVQAAREIPGDLVHELGGTDRIAQVIATSTKGWEAHEVVELLAGSTPPKKLTVGLSTVSVSNFDTEAFANELKKTAAARGIKIRFILPRKSSRLNAAQVEANRLTKHPHAEYTLIKENEGWLLVRTLEVQDIRAYELRDTRRPARDAKVGMLPPKLAQMMINIGLPTHLPTSDKSIILDPFCGMGTVLQEAWLLDLAAIGSDSSERMVKYSTTNLTWLYEHFSLSKKLQPNVLVHDVHSPFPAEFRGKISSVVTEPYLGKPLRSPLLARDAAAYIEPLAELYLAALKNVRPLLSPDGTVLFLLPAFRRGHRKNDTFTLFPDGFLDAVEQLGYSQLQLIPAELEGFLLSSDRGTLLYSRPDALVAREFTFWQKAE